MKKREIWGTPPLGANENFLAHSTDAKSLRTIISNICEKIIKIWCADLQISRHTRTDARTHEHESIGPSLMSRDQKISKKSSTVWKKMAKNSPKPSNVTTSNVFLTQKWPKGQNKNFTDTTLPFDDSKQLSQVSDQVLDKSDVWIRRKCPKTWFFC